MGQPETQPGSLPTLSKCEQNIHLITVPFLAGTGKSGEYLTKAASGVSSG
jgi:hypothetical protein